VSFLPELFSGWFWEVLEVPNYRSLIRENT
jgi:hypothetical protein